jgi:transcriptional regulator GlxA family with amidase domain
LIAQQQAYGQTLWTADRYDWIEQTLREFVRDRSAGAGAHPHDIARILAYVHANLFDSSLNVSVLKVRCQLRNNNVTTRFRRTVGMGLREYIEKLRLEAAARLLEQREIAVYLVAMAVGYEHQETFCRAFQRQFDRTPSEHRMKNICQVEGSINW